MYTCILYTYMRIHICRNSVHLDSSGPGSRCLVPNLRLTSQYLSYSVYACQCVYINIHSHTLPPPSKNIEVTNRTTISPSAQNNPARQATSALDRLANPPHPCHSMPINKLRMQESMCTPCSKGVCKCVRWCQNTCVTYTLVYALVLRTPV